MKLFDIEALSSLRGNMDRCCDHARAGKNSCKPSRSEVVANKNAAIKAEKTSASLKRVRETLFPVKPFARIAAVKQIGTHNFRVLAGLRIPANAEITRGELCNALRATGFTGFRFVKTGKRILSLA